MVGEQISLFDKKIDNEYEKLIKGSKLNIKTSQLAMDYGISAIKFNKLLKAIGFHKRVNNQWIPCTKYLGYGLVESKTLYYDNMGHICKDETNSCGMRIVTNYTPVGRYVIYKLLKNIGVVPEIERNIGYDKSIINDVIRADKICNINIENIVWEFCR